MRCPRCRQEASEGAALCDNCNEILDPSILEGVDDAPVHGERTDVGQQPTAANPVRRDLRPARLSQRGNWNARPGEPDAERRPYLAPPPAPPPPSVLDEAHRTAGDLGAFFRSLQPADRLAAGGAAALLFTLALPWRWTRRDDDIIGLVAAWPLALLAGGVIALVYWRAQKADALRSRQLQLAQAATAALAAALAGLFLPFATEQRAVRVVGFIVTSRPLLGAYLGLVFAAVVLLGSLSTALAARARH